jgi:hypothetical protein
MGFEREGRRMSARRRMTYTATTRRMTAGLPESFDPLVVDALWHARVVDSAEERTAERQRSSVLWREAIDRIGARIADDARRSGESWGTGPLRAV